MAVVATPLNNTSTERAQLEEFLRHYAEPPELRAGDLVTARRVSFPEMHGRLFVVLEHRPDAEPVAAGGPMLPVGGRAEVRVAVAEGDCVTTFWAERYAFEPWFEIQSPSNSEAGSKQGAR